MTTSTSNLHTSIIDDTILEASHSHGLATLTVLEYPSLAGQDDELLPSGD
ncbi:MAG: hypothetical protein ABSG07_06430 [Terriglobales bacterium]|jgi:hypothetical protein